MNRKIQVRAQISVTLRATVSVDLQVDPEMKVGDTHAALIEEATRRVQLPLLALAHEQADGTTAPTVEANVLHTPIVEGLIDE